MNMNKNGARARMGLYMALVSMLSQERADAFFQKRRENRHPRGGDTRRQDHDSPAGFKLIKKMHRQPAKIGRVPISSDRKRRRWIRNGYAGTLAELMPVKSIKQSK